MKRILLITSILLILALILVYTVIPSKFIIVHNAKIPVNREAPFRKLSDQKKWSEWWPEPIDIKNKKNAFRSKNFEYLPGPGQILSVPFSIKSGQHIWKADLLVTASGTDSTILQMETTIKSSFSPINRIGNYFRSRKISSDFNSLLASISTTYSDTKSLYGFDIRKALVVDSTLIFTYDEIKGYPGTSKIYSLIDELRDHIKINAAQETGYPMLNIFTKDSIVYLVKVAIPVNKRLPDKGKISYRWMLRGGNILVAEIKGGPDLIQKAHEQMVHYIQDHQRITPAIFFEALVTERRLQPDSSKWVTKIYYPVM